MKLITRDTDYAIRALCYIARRKEKMAACENLVKSLNIPKPFLRKILQKLNKKGLLKSYKGKGGGFLLSKPADKILVTDLIRIFQGPVRLSEHIFKKGSCPHIKTCALRRKLDAIEEDVILKLKTISITSLIKDVIRK